MSQLSLLVMRTSPPGDHSAGFARGLLRRLGVELHPGETPTVLALFGTFFFCLCFQYAAKSVRQATFVDEFGAELLPVVYLAVALLTLPIVYGYGRLADRLSPARLTSLTCGSTAAGLVVFWWLYGSSAAWVRRPPGSTVARSTASPSGRPGREWGTPRPPWDAPA